jgi:hypothetical protein
MIYGENMMQTYVLRIYRARPEDEGSVYGVIEDIESGHKECFNSLVDLQAMLAHSITMGQLQLPDLAPQELTHLEPVAMVG